MKKWSCLLGINIHWNFFSQNFLSTVTVYLLVWATSFQNSLFDAGDFSSSFIWPTPVFYPVATLVSSRSLQARSCSCSNRTCLVLGKTEHAPLSLLPLALCSPRDLNVSRKWFIFILFANHFPKLSSSLWFGSGF